MQLCVWTVDALITLKLKKNPLIFVCHSIFLNTLNDLQILISTLYVTRSKTSRGWGKKGEERTQHELWSEKDGLKTVFV